MWPMCLNMYWRSNLLAVGSLSISCLMASARSPGFGIMATSSKWGIMSTVSTGSGSSLLMWEMWEESLVWIMRNIMSSNKPCTKWRWSNLASLWFFLLKVREISEKDKSIHKLYILRDLKSQNILGWHDNEKSYLRYCFNSEATTWGSWSANLTGSPELYWRRRCCTLLFTPLRR